MNPMLYAAKMILDIPYSSFTERNLRINADSLDSLITETIPHIACQEVEALKETEWKKIGWKHVNMKFCVQDIQLEFVFDQEKKNVAAVYIVDDRTGEVLSQSDPSIAYYDQGDEGRLAAEVSERWQQNEVRTWIIRGTAQYS